MNKIPWRNLVIQKNNWNIKLKDKTRSLNRYLESAVITAKRTDLADHRVLLNNTASQYNLFNNVKAIMQTYTPDVF